MNSRSGITNCNELHRSEQHDFDSETGLGIQRCAAGFWGFRACAFTVLLALCKIWDKCAAQVHEPAYENTKPESNTLLTV